MPFNRKNFEQKKLLKEAVYKENGYECLWIDCKGTYKYGYVVQWALPKVIEFLHNGYEIISIQKLKRKQKVYNFKCFPYENFFVNGILTHNCSGRNAVFASIVIARAEAKILNEECDRVIISAGWSQLSEECAG